MADDPIDGQILLLTAAKASVPPIRLPDLLERVQATAESNRDRYRQAYERIHDDEDLEAFLVADDQWDELAADVGLSDRELSAVRRAHEAQFRRIGRRTDRETEFERTLEIRSPLLVGRD
ncbi:hypothetical protein [Natrarchaeobius oligotrophus]|uniref:DUF8048 domain-containing protein n=1 Tax=Natrarchaeobius chitinivorans TaxID=1679083 RepID=A0A3N6MUN8_NATCH|nr:hypothetical protein [Natrarchaeobius chitinivorans]RQG98566.1 hypothetical protein EA472_17330 [Natrarchaeobius chitinivorans]